MNIACAACGSSYDDALCTTICPHEQFISNETAKQKDLAMTLLGKDVCFAHMPNEKYHVYAINADGMVSIHGMVGEFAPHIFKVAE